MELICFDKWLQYIIILAKMFTAILALGFFSSAATGEIFRCIEKASGEVTFTDTACPGKGAGDSVPVGPANVDSGYPTEEEITERREQRQKEQAEHRQAWIRQNEEAAERERVRIAEQEARRFAREREFEKRRIERERKRKRDRRWRIQ